MNFLVISSCLSFLHSSFHLLFHFFLFVFLFFLEISFQREASLSTYIISSSLFRFLYSIRIISFSSYPRFFRFRFFHSSSSFHSFNPYIGKKCPSLLSLSFSLSLSLKRTRTLFSSWHLIRSSLKRILHKERKKKFTLRESERKNSDVMMVKKGSLVSWTRHGETSSSEERREKTREERNGRRLRQGEENEEKSPDSTKESLVQPVT